MGKGCKGGFHSRGCSHGFGGGGSKGLRGFGSGGGHIGGYSLGGYRSGGGARLYGGGGYRPYRPYIPRSYTPPAPPSYTPQAMDAVQAAIRERQAKDAARLAQQPYGGNPLQQQRPDLQYQTIQTDNRAEYYRLTQAQGYQQRDANSGAAVNAVHKALDALNGNPNP